MAAPKLTDDDRQLITARHNDGETITELAKEYGIAFSTARKAIEKVQGGRITTKGMPAVSITEFRKQARKILWRINPGKEKVQYNKWEAMVKELQEKGNMSGPQAVIQASKSFDALRPLFATVDISALDPQPGSHPDIICYGKDGRPAIQCENRTLTNRENLAWAIETAGEEKSPEGSAPIVCPNWAAYFLYLQALSDPGNFTGKYLQAEMRSGDDDDDEKRKKSGKRSIAEINEMIETLNQEPEGEES